MASDMQNPYYAYIKLDIGDYSLDTRDDAGPISLQVVYETDAICTYTIEAYDDIARELANAIIDSGAVINIEYGYSNGKGMKSVECSIMNIHTELINNSGEIITIETVPTPLSKVMNSADDYNSYDRKYTGSASEILRKVISDIGWQEGYIVDTGHLRGENNGNDNLADPNNYQYWRAEMPATEFMKSLKDFANTGSDGGEGQGNFILFVHYEGSEPPTVDFFPQDDEYYDENYRGADGKHTIVYGDPDSEVISFQVDWGDALLSKAGYTGLDTYVQDSITNDEYGSGDVMGYEESETSGATQTSYIDPSNLATSDLRNNGKITSGDHIETWYSTLKPDSPAFTYTLNAGGGDASWEISYRDDGVLTWGGYVCVAADISGNYSADGGYPAAPNHEGRYKRGDIVETSLGQGIVVDGCLKSVYTENDLFDVATNWKRS